MVRIRLAKTGRKKAPSYRIIVTDSRSPRDGKHIEVIGLYNPSHNPEIIELDEKRYDYWVSVGAKPSKTVKELKNKEYEFVPYTRQNENKEEGGEESSSQPKEKNDENKKESSKEEKEESESNKKEDSKEEDKEEKTEQKGEKGESSTSKEDKEEKEKEDKKKK